MPITPAARRAFELITGRPVPDNPSAADVARARTALALYERDRRSLAGQKGAQTRRVNRQRGVRDERDEQLDLAMWARISGCTYRMKASDRSGTGVP